MPSAERLRGAKEAMHANEFTPLSNAIDKFINSVFERDDVMRNSAEALRGALAAENRYIGANPIYKKVFKLVPANAIAILKFDTRIHSSTEMSITAHYPESGVRNTFYTQDSLNFMVKFVESEIEKILYDTGFFA